MTVVEVLVAVTVVTVVLFGAVAFLVNGRTRVELAGKQRTASQVAADRIERARALGYDGVKDDEGNVELDGTTYTWTLTVATALADPADSKSTYKIVEVSVDWPTSGNDPVVLRTAMSP